MSLIKCLNKILMALCHIIIGIFHPVVASFNLLGYLIFPSIRQTRADTKLLPSMPLHWQFVGILIPVILWIFYVSQYYNVCSGLNVVGMSFLAWSILLPVHFLLSMVVRYGDIQIGKRGRFLVGLPSLWLIVDSRKDIKPLDTKPRITLLSEAVLSYISLVFSFSIIYHCFYLLNPHSYYFSTGCLHRCISYFDFVYFSFVTVATVGFGDISPTDINLRFFVVLQIVLILTYFPLIVTSFFESLKAS